jgi:hypothetical protein
MNPARFGLLTGMIAMATVTRLLPHAPNFTPLLAMALFGGACFSDKRAAFLVPLTGMFLSDLVLGFHALMPIVYGSFALIVCLGFWLSRHRGTLQVALAATASSLWFFVATNGGVWAIGSMYPHTISGLSECYVMAIPFFWTTLTSSLLYSALLFGGLRLAEMRFSSLGEAPVPVGAN